MTECSSCRYNKLIGSMCGCDGVYSERCYQPAKPKPTNADRIQVCLPRGKRLDNGDWVEGNLICSKNFAIGSQEFPLEMPLVVDPATVGQYTGQTAQCTDKIFEGDRCIVTTFDHEGMDYQHECVVVWDSGCLAFSNEKNEFWLPIACVEDTDSDVEVIGNVHDNPELLEATPCSTK